MPTLDPNLGYLMENQFLDVTENSLEFYRVEEFQ